MLNIVHTIPLRIENVKIEQQREIRCRQETLKVGRTGRDCRAHGQIDNHMECRGGERKRETTIDDVQIKFWPKKDRKKSVLQLSDLHMCPLMWLSYTVCKKYTD